MSKYVNLDDVIKRLTEATSTPLHKLIDVLVSVPSADVVTVKHGHWIDVHHDYSVARCSACRNELDAVSPIGKENKEFWELFLSMEKYCPNCGAKMDGGVSE